MQLHLTLDIPPLQKQVTYTDKIMLTGSCFTEHIAGRLAQYKFSTLANPHGILFNPISVAESLDSYISATEHTHQDLFYYNELWNSWKHHTRFSHIEQQAALAGINKSQQNAGAFIKQADYLIITLGSAFQYFLKDTGMPVANNHRAPAQWFDKKLLGTDEIINALGDTLTRLTALNPGIHVLFTISPVRHIRDGVTENNRSKARLIEAVHSLCDQFANAYYFPAYELVIDILRDYRYYDVDFVHPNYLATSYVWQEFAKACVTPATQAIMQQVQELVTARAHRPRFPETEAHQKFMASHAAKTQAIMQQYPFLDLKDELQYFAGNG